MVAYKSSAVARFLKSPDPSCRAVLLYGPDAGLIAERASALARRFAERTPGSAEIVRLDDRDLAEDPARIEVELRTRPMFAASQVVRVMAGQRLDVPSLKALLGSPFDNMLIVEAGNLRPDSALRRLFESNKSAAALPCYGDEHGLASLVDAELAEAGLRIGSEARSYLMARLGADQALSRSEVMKLAAYAKGREEVTHDDIDAIVGDAAETALETFVYAASSGNASAALRELRRLAASGTESQPALIALARHFTQLHKVAAVVAAGRRTDEALRSLRPPPRPKSREDLFLAHCRRLGPTRLSQALPLIQQTIRRTRRQPELEGAFTERLLLTLTAKI